MSKIYIATKNVALEDLGIDSTYDHLYLVYDPNDVLDGDELIIRCGPDLTRLDWWSGTQVVFGHFDIENGFDIDASADDFDSGDTPSSRYFTLLNINGLQTDHVWAAMQAHTAAIEDRRAFIPYMLEFDAPLDYVVDGVNSNSFISSIVMETLGLGSMIDRLPDDPSASWPGLGVSLVDAPEDGYVIEGLNYLLGNAQNNVISGASAANNYLIDGGAGADTLYGNAGDDFLFGGEGNDSLNGGKGTDTADYSTEQGGGAISVSTTGNPLELEVTDTFGDTDALTGIEEIIFTGLADTLTLGALVNGQRFSFDGGGGTDTFYFTGGVYNENDGEVYDEIGSAVVAFDHFENVVALDPDYVYIPDFSESGDLAVKTDFSAYSGDVTITITQTDWLDYSPFINPNFAYYEVEQSVAVAISGGGEYSKLLGTGGAAVTSSTPLLYVFDEALSEFYESAPDGIRIIGTNNGDTVIINDTSTTIHSPAFNFQFVSGLGNDHVQRAESTYAEDSDLIYVYTGGQDTIEEAGELLGSLIIRGDYYVDQTSITFGGTNLTLNFGSGNSITLEDVLDGADTPSITFETGGSIGYNLIEEIFESSGEADDHVSIDGTWDDDVFEGRSGKAQIYYGKGGNDDISTGDGDDVLSGGLGNDTLEGGAGNDWYLYETGLDEITDSAGRNRLSYGAGLDSSALRIEQSGFDTKLIFRAGLDELTINNDAIESIQFSDGTMAFSDFIKHFLLAEDLRGELFEGDGSPDTHTASARSSMIFGYAGDDILNGDDGDDVIDGGDDDDTISGGDGNDSVHGGTGHNILLGGAGSDTIDAEDGDDDLEGGDGSDRLWGGDGDNTLDGGSGDDLIYLGIANDTATGGDGDDILVVQIGALTIITDFTPGDDVIDLTNFYNVDEFSDLNFASFGSGPTLYTNVYLGEIGDSQVLKLEGLHDWELDAADFIFGAGGEFAFHDWPSTPMEDEIFGTEEADELYADDIPTQMWGYEGNDLLYGWSGDDVLSGNEGDDELIGDDGDDRLYGGHGSDTLYGDWGNDYYVLDWDGAASIDIIYELDGTDYLVLPIEVAPEDIDFYVDTGQDTLQVSYDGETAGLGAIIVGQFEGEGSNVEFIVVQNVVYDLDDVVANGFSGGVPFGEWTPDTSALYANDDDIAVDEDTVITGNVFADNGNGVDYDTNGISLEAVAQDFEYEGERFQLFSTGYFIYTPGANYSGLSSFEYTVRDADGNEADAWVTFDLAAVNDAPLAQDDEASGNEGSGITGNVLANNGNGADSDVESQALTVTAGTFATAQGGSITIETDGDFSYTPATLFYGEDAFTYTVTDASSASSQAVLRLTVNSIYTIVAGTNGAETLTGTSANERLLGHEGDDTLAGGTGNDVLNGGGGRDTVTYASASGAITASLASGTASGEGSDVLQFIQNLIGSAYADTLTGDANANVLTGGAGNDTIDGGDGTDTADYAAASSAVNVNLSTGAVTGGAGSDTLSSIENVLGSAYNDTITGSTAVNALYGGAGTDTIGGADGNDAVYGEDGADTLYGNAGDDTLYGGEGNDTIRGDNMSGTDVTGHDTLYGGDGNDTMAGGLGNDLLYGDAGADEIYGNGGNDEIHGGDGNDLIYGDTTTAQGSDGADVIYGDAGDDDIAGSGGNDEMHGGNNDDDLYGHAGTDTLYGDAGVDRLYGGDDADILNGGAGNDSLNGDAGNDELHGGDDTDALAGGDGADTLYGDGGTDTLYGNAGADTLIGGDGNDTLNGGDDNDILKGGAGTDTLSGNGGSDTYVFEAASAFSNVDAVGGFSLGENDKLDISDILDGYYTFGVDVITDFVRITDNGTNSTLAIDQNGTTGGSSYVTIATLYAVTGLTDEAALETSGKLLAA